MWVSATAQKNDDHGVSEQAVLIGVSPPVPAKNASPDKVLASNQTLPWPQRKWFHHQYTLLERKMRLATCIARPPIFEQVSVHIIWHIPFTGIVIPSASKRLAIIFFVIGALKIKTVIRH